MFKRKKKIENFNDIVESKRKRKGSKLTMSLTLPIPLITIFGTYVLSKIGVDVDNNITIYKTLIYATFLAPTISFLYTTFEIFINQMKYSKYDVWKQMNEEEFKHFRIESKYADNFWDLILIVEEIAKIKSEYETMTKSLYIDAYKSVIIDEDVTRSKFKENRDFYTRLFDEFIDDYFEEKNKDCLNIDTKIVCESVDCFLEEETKNEKTNKKDSLAKLDDIVEEIKQLERIREVEYRN